MAETACERREILRLGLPITLSMTGNVTLPFLSFAMLGWMSSDALYVRSLYIPLSQLFVALLLAFETSAQTAVALAAGRQRLKDVPALLRSALVLGLAGGIGLFLVLFTTAPLLAELLSVPADARGTFMSFLRWTAAASVLHVVPVVCAACLRGAGRPSRAAAIVLTTAVLEVACVAVFGFGADLGLWSVPLGITVGCVAGAGLAWHALRGGGPLPPGRGGHAVREVTGHLRSVGLPVAGTFLVLFCFSLAQLWIVGPFGEGVVSGFSLAVTLQGVVIQPALALGTATAILMNQRRGAGRTERLHRILRSGLELTALAYLPLALAVWALAGPVAALATGDETAAREAAHYLRVVGPSYLMMGVTLAAFTVLEQIGRGRTALLLNAGFFTVLAVSGLYAARHFDTPSGLYWVVSAGNVGGAAAVLFVVRAARSLHVPTSSSFAQREAMSESE
ncbi:MATE family efflux transporter [Streptomyces sp. NBC_00525]|uniref:MATE family efflux transporter n=1 Tax=Streptomyces sp. NBC_00525 TaxID=2903660 RepID=UPI002E823BB4|nr:MATE family efflux transporter [Streptomyces sp. NBC_00525]WUC96301.1 MATE family efflux transporter [Streptomyces sp. NBC_00525]